MTRTEQKVNSYSKELDKLFKRRERINGLLKKNIDKLAAHGIVVDRFETDIYDTLLEADKAIYWNVCIYENELKDVERSISAVNKNLGKYTHMLEEEQMYEAIDAESTKRANYAECLYSKISEEEIKQMQEQVRQEWAKDGIIIEEFRDYGLYGTTPSGKHFNTYINNGVTERSWHCYTLFIDGAVMFTSGTIANCYKTIKRK